MSTMWLSGGKLVTDITGKPILCADCPCVPAGSETCEGSADFGDLPFAFTGSLATVGPPTYDPVHNWFFVTAPSTGSYCIRIKLDAGDEGDFLGIEMYSGTCASLSFVSGSSVTAPNYVDFGTWGEATISLMASTTYYIHVACPFNLAGCTYTAQVNIGSC